MKRAAASTASARMGAVCMPGSTIRTGRSYRLCPIARGQASVTDNKATGSLIVLRRPCESRAIFAVSELSLNGLIGQSIAGLVSAVKSGPSARDPCLREHLLVEFCSRLLLLQITCGLRKADDRRIPRTQQL